MGLTVHKHYDRYFLLERLRQNARFVPRAYLQLWRSLRLAHFFWVFERQGDECNRSKYFFWFLKTNGLILRIFSPLMGSEGWRFICSFPSLILRLAPPDNGSSDTAEFMVKCI